jgi:hypothetical protein
MLREIYHIIPFKNFAEEALNCWLSYTMSQPVSFDIAIVFLFALQYFGIKRMSNLFSLIVSGQPETSDDMIHYQETVKFP